MTYEYKCVQALFVREGKKSLGVQAQEIINKNAVDGWEYYNTATADEIVRAGCISALFGGKDVLLNHSLFVFRKQKNG